MNARDYLLACQQQMSNYQHLTQDKRFGSRVSKGMIQLVHVTIDGKGKSVVSPRSRWIKMKNWLAFLRSISI